MKQTVLFILLIFSIAISSCNKEIEPLAGESYYQMKVNGKKVRIQACGTSNFYAEYLVSDTIIFAAFGCAGERAGFLLHGMEDGTYRLDETNQVWYDLRPASYVTNTLKTGTITIESKEIKLPANGRRAVLEGTFAFDAVDKNTGEQIKVTDGKFRLEKLHSR